MPGEFELIEGRLLPQLRRICHDPFRTNGNSEPRAEHVPSILLRDMREMTIAPSYPTGMDFRSSDDRGRTTARRLLYENRRDIWQYWDLAFRADPQRQGRAMQWTAHPVIGAMWSADEMQQVVAGKTETAKVIGTHAKHRLPQGNQFRRLLARQVDQVQTIRAENDYCRRLGSETQLAYDVKALDNVEPRQVPPPDPADYPESHELLICENPGCIVRYWLRKTKRGRKPKQCPECRVKAA